MPVTVLPVPTFAFANDAVAEADEQVTVSPVSMTATEQPVIVASVVASYAVLPAVNEIVTGFWATVNNSGDRSRRGPVGAADLGGLDGARARGQDRDRVDGDQHQRGVWELKLTVQPLVRSPRP